MKTPTSSAVMMAVGSAIADSELAARRSTIRAFNEYLVETTGAARRGVALLACECGGEECSESLSVSLPGYDAARNHRAGGALLVVAGHEDGQRVLYENDRIALIEGGLDPGLSGDGNRAATVAGPGRRVLVVDDDAAIRMICAINLKAEGFSVIEASDGREGLELARSERPDLIVTDVKMPRCDGFEFTETLRRDEKTREIPVVFMTGDIDKTHEARAHGLGALAFLAKPFDPRELIAITLSAFA